MRQQSATATTAATSSSSAATTTTLPNAPLLPHPPPPNGTLVVRGGCHCSHCWYLIGSALYVSVAVWDMRREQSWYTVAVNDNDDDDDDDTDNFIDEVTTSIATFWNATALSDENHDENHSTQQHRNHLFVFASSVVRTLFRRIDLYLLLSILAASCYVIVAVSCLWSTCRTLPPPPPTTTTTVAVTTGTEQHQPPTHTTSSPENDTATSGVERTIQRNIHSHNPTCRIEREHERGSSSSSSSSSLHRLQQQTNSNRYHSSRTLWIALTFGMGATLDLLAACTSETIRYPNVSTYAVVGAAHAYLTNAILVVTHPLQNPSTTTPGTTSITRLFGRTRSSQKVTFMADGLFLIGSMVDVALSYFYIGENWDESITVWVYIYRGYLVSSILWFLNAILYIVADICVDNNDSTIITSNESQGSTMVRTDVVSNKHAARFGQNQHQDSYSDPPRNIDPVSLLFDHSLLLHESTTMTTEQLPSRDDTNSTASASFTHGGDVYILSA